MAFQVRWCEAGKDWQEKELPDELLQKTLDRAWSRFGDPTKHSGSDTNEINRLGPALTLPPPRTSTNKRAGK